MKGFLQSKTVWGIIIVFVCLGVRMYGLIRGAVVPPALEWTLNAFTLGGLGWAGFGRLTCYPKISFKPIDAVKRSPPFLILAVALLGLGGCMTIKGSANGEAWMYQRSFLDTNLKVADIAVTKGDTKVVVHLEGYTSNTAQAVTDAMATAKNLSAVAAKAGGL